MDYTVAFYVHHHGAGHLMRAITIAKQLNNKDIYFLGSNLKHYQKQIPENIKCIDLPLDVVSKSERLGVAIETSKNFLYAPLNIKGIRERNLLLVQFFAAHFPLIFIVDTSPEIVALSRLCSIPTISFMQHGFRNDLAHLMAYDNSADIIAPFPQSLKPNYPNWVHERTFFSGGFSKYPIQNQFKNEDTKKIGILIGAGGSSIDLKFVVHLALYVSSYQFNVIGAIDHNGLAASQLPNNLKLLGHLKEPIESLLNCHIILGNAGQNTVMEVATLNKRFICVPENRPFFEQRDKADRIRSEFNIPVVLPDNLYATNWQKLFDEVGTISPNWQGMININAVQEICERINLLAKKVYG